MECYGPGAAFRSAGSIDELDLVDVRGNGFTLASTSLSKSLMIDSVTRQ